MRALAFLLLATAACDKASYGDVMTDPQLPPRGSSDIHDWLEAGHYLTWTCESAPHPRRLGSGHGPNRICSNDLLRDSTGDGPYPVGAAAVKEIYDSGGRIAVYAVYRKVTDGGGGDSWYWYEGSRGDTVANGEGEDTCTDCHNAAPRDFVYTVVR